MNIEEIQKRIKETQVTWNCHASRDMHVIGCPHKEWTKDELHDALIQKMKFEQSGLAGTIIR